MSGGSGDPKVSIRPVAGCGSESSEACSAWRQSRRLARSGSVISSSNRPGGAGVPPLSASRRKISSEGP
jgi:hypothetical protein